MNYFEVTVATDRSGFGSKFVKVVECDTMVQAIDVAEQSVADACAQDRADVFTLEAKLLPMREILTPLK